MEDKNCKKSLLPRWLIDLGISLLLITYGYIFNGLVTRIDKVEARVDAINPPLLQIQTDLAGIKVNVEWLKQQQTKDKK
jgi:hypothetical protein